MPIHRRKFLKIGSFVTANLAVLPLTGNRTVWAAAGYASKSHLEVDYRALKAGFVQPPDSTKASCYWWWFNSLVNKEGITRDLEEYRSKGMGSVLLIVSSDGLGGNPIPEGPKFLSAAWKALFRHALKEAERLGIEVGINLCTGWCMGGPWIEPEHSGRWFLQSELTVTGPRTFSEQLPLPGNRSGYDKVFNPPGYKQYIDLPLSELDYRDTAVVAFREDEKEGTKFTGKRAALIPAKTNRKDASNWTPANLIVDPPLVPWNSLPQDQPIPSEGVIDLTAELGPDGHLKWEVPDGTWTIVRTGHRMTGSRLMLPLPEADGLSIDWLSKAGIEQQFEHLGKVLLAEAGPLAGKTLKYFHDDSFEDGFPNWTENILEEFSKRRGYDATPYLPVFGGRIVGSAEVSDRFLYDYRKTVADCMADNHYGRFAELCHQQGLEVQNEAAGPSRSGTMCMDALKNLGRSDRPMGEFWLGKRYDEEGGLDPKLGYGVTRMENGQNKVTKMVASAAHIYGKPTASAEAFTSFRPHWVDYPALLKPMADRAFCEGINRIVIHTSTATRPEDGKPGYEYGAGTHFNPNVTWWDKSAGFFSYIGRCQHLLRSGTFFADILYYNGDWAPNLVDPKHIDPSVGKGYDYDVCNEEVLLNRLSVKENRLMLPGGTRYRILVLPDTKNMPVAVVNKIKELVASGGTVVGPKPERDPGLQHFPQCDEIVKQVAGEIWGDCDGKTVKEHRLGKGRVFWGMSLSDLLKADGIEPDFIHAGDAKTYIDFVHRSTKAAEIYFVANRNNREEKIDCRFRITGKQPELWDPVSGKIHEVACFKQEGSQTIIPMEFLPHQSFFIVFKQKRWMHHLIASKKENPDFLKCMPLQQIVGPWTVKFDTAWGGPEEIVFAELEDWSKRQEEGIRHFSGTATYVKHFTLAGPLTAGGRFLLHLGIVKNIAEVKLNGVPLGIVWTAPWQVDITDVVKQEENELEIEVVNLWPNRLVGDAARAPEERLTHTNIPFQKDMPLLPSGLLGPVRILKVLSS